ncbi:MAG TPA: hypothetical protein VN152_04265 [Sphingopyxis sp.]|nr:hypothetical protein [Sphingopyxis sp.]
MKTPAMILIAAAACTVPQAAFASCADFRASSSELSLQYDPFSPAGVERTFTLRTRRLDPDITAVRVVIADPGSIERGAALGLDNAVRYDIRWTRDSGRIVFVSGAEQPNATNGALIQFGPSRSGDSVNESFRIRIPAGQAIGAGDYYQPLELRFICYTGRDEIDRSIQTGSQVAVNLRVPERISTFVGSPGTRRGRIDFGEIDALGGNQIRGLIVTAQSTIPYDIRVDTERGALKRSDRDDAEVPYSLKLSGFPVSDRSRLVCDRTPAPGGRAHNLQVELNGDDLRKAPAGAYRDIVTLTFSPRLGLAGGEGCSATRG